MKVARSYDGLVERLDVGGVETRGVPGATVALKRAWYSGLRLFFRPEGLKDRRSVVAMFVLWLIDPASVHKALPDLVGDVVYGVVSLNPTFTPGDSFSE